VREHEPEREGGMSDDPRRLTTEEQRERLYAARYRGGMCAVCGRTLDDGEPVFWERFPVGRVGGITSHPLAPVGSECASPRLREQKEGEEPEPCVSCGRPVYYARPSVHRTEAVCSGRCRGRASFTRRSAPTGGKG
jgi:hypothetical protein